MKCDGKCNGKCKLLGSLEQKIMDVLWFESNPQKPADVLKKLDHPYAYTTVMTILKRMWDKGLLRRHINGKVYMYTSAIDRQTFAHDAMIDLFERLTISYPQEFQPVLNEFLVKKGIRLPR